MPAPEQAASTWIAIAVTKSPAWHEKVTACFRNIAGKGLVVSEDDFLNGSIHADAADLHMMMIEANGGTAAFRSAMSCVDNGFLQAGGPVVAMVDVMDAALRDQLLDLGASRVVAADVEPAALRRLLNFDGAEYGRVKRLRADLERRMSAIGDVLSGTFRLQTRREAQNLATMLSLASRDRHMVAVGLSELIVNGIEHGCLGIGHDEKGRLIEEGTLVAEIRRRRALPQYADNLMTVDFRRTDESLEFTITDPGPGFDHEAMAAEPVAHLKKHGRGILMAKACFDHLEYRGHGNIVFAVHKLKD